MVGCSGFSRSNLEYQTPTNKFCFPSFFRWILSLASQLSGCCVSVGVCLPSVCAGDAYDFSHPWVNLARAILNVLQGCAWTLPVFLVYNAAVQVQVQRNIYSKHNWLELSQIKDSFWLKGHRCAFDAVMWAEVKWLSHLSLAACFKIFTLNRLLHYKAAWSEMFLFILIFRIFVVFYFFKFSSVPVAIGVCVFVWSGSWLLYKLLDNQSINCRVESSNPDSVQEWSHLNFSV